MIKKATKKPVGVGFITFDKLKLIWEEGPKESFTRDYGQQFEYNENEKCFVINTLEGDMKMTDKDVLIIGVQGEMYPCKIDIFKKTYDYEGEL